MGWKPVAQTPANNWLPLTQCQDKTAHLAEFTCQCGQRNNLMVYFNIDQAFTVQHKRAYCSELSCTFWRGPCHTSWHSPVSFKLWDDIKGTRMLPFSGCIALLLQQWTWVDVINTYICTLFQWKHSRHHGQLLVLVLFGTVTAFLIF